MINILMQLGSAIPTSPLEMITAATSVTKVVLLILVILSFISWALMLAKWVEFRRVRKVSDLFMREFDRATTMEHAHNAARRIDDSPHARVTQRAARFIQDTTPALAPTADRSGRFSSSQVEALHMVLDSEAGAERDRLARFIPWLATIGSVSPLIGLLGTVLGVIEAFIGIATQGSGNIGAVAPGVAEALIATAAALSVAIPAVFGYNIFASRLAKLDNELEGFASELIALLVREGRV